jgi:hypothetical protein
LRIALIARRKLAGDVETFLMAIGPDLTLVLSPRYRESGVTGRDHPVTKKLLLGGVCWLARWRH